MDVIFHGKSDQRITLIDVAYVPDLGFNLYSLHAVQRTHLIVSDASGTHIIGANLTFPRSSSGSYLRATRLPAGTVEARRRQGDMRATNLLRQLGQPIPPPSQEPPPRRNMCATGLQNSNVPGVVTVLEPTPFPPLSSVLGEIQFVGKTPPRPACRIGTPPLATTALIPGPLKHGKEVDVNHLHVSLAHAHASVLKATVKQHGIRLTGELVSCSACSRAKGHRAPIFRCVAHSLSLSLLCLHIWAILHYLYMYMVAFLALRILYVVAPVCFVFCSLVFPLLNPFLAMMSSAGYFHARLLLPAFFSFFRPCSSPICFWCNFLYLVTTAGFVADQ